MSALSARVPVHFFEHRNDDAWAWAGAIAIAGALRRGLAHQPRVRLLVSGGTTPAPVFRALARAPLDWPRVDVGLVDERWLRPDDHDSNAWLVRTHLLHDRAATARFEPLTRSGCSIEAAVATANLHARQPADVVVLGMGGDGHTASLFPGMADLDRALASNAPYVAVNADGCPGAGAWSLRITSTPAGLAPATTRILLLRGIDKRAVFERALEGADPRELPIRIAFLLPGAPLDVYWCR